MPQEQFSSYQIGKMLNVSRQAVNQWIDKGYIRSYRTPGGHRRVRREDLLAFLQARQIPVPPVLLSAEAAHTVTRKMTVMMVDDDQDYSSLMSVALGDRFPHLKVKAFDNGYDALVELGATPPDLLVLDLKMPQMDSIEVCRRLKENELTSNVPIMVLSGHDVTEWESKLQDLRVEEICLKSSSPEEIAERIALLLNCPAVV